MFYVTSLDGSQVEPLFNIGPDFKLEQSVDGTFTVSSSCFPGDNNPGYDLLKSETVITVDSNDFKVKQYRDSAYSKNITALSIFFEQSKTQRHGIFSGSHTLNNHLNFVLVGTGWSFTVDSAIANITNYITDFGNDNVVSLVNKICKYHACEYQILPNNRLHFAKEIGPDEDYQYRYKHNVSNVVLIEDTTNLYTYIKGFGADGLEVDYTSPNVSVYGFKEAPPIRDERFKDRTALLNYIKNSLKDVPDLAIESKIPELTNRAIGERIWLIYEPLGIEMQTRILKQTRVLRNGELVTESVVFGNTLIQSSIDILIEQQQQINETEKVIDEAKKEYRSAITQTDERISLEVEQLEGSIASIDIKADNISLSVNNRITNEMAAINLKADNINLSVNSRITNEVSAINIRTGEIESSVSNLATNTNSSITQLSNNINLKVDKGGSITDINVSPGVVRINAEKLDLTGALIVNGSITGATTINVSTDINLGRMIRFDDFTAISTTGGSLLFDAYNTITYQGSRHYFYGTVDFSNATLVGLPK